MRNYFLPTLLFFIIGSASLCRAQPYLYGNSYYGGTNRGGTIFNVNFSGSSLTVDHDFQQADVNPYGDVVQASNGLLYGLTTIGGTGDSGSIFSFNTLTNSYTLLYSFMGGNDGATPYGSLIQDVDGLLYGMTAYGGANDSGIIFSYNITTGIETKLHDFGNGTDGQFPYGSLILATNGLLFGLTTYGGTNGHGTIFSYNINSATENVLYNFGSDTDGADPHGSLLQASNGVLYGMTKQGGSKGYGIVFSYNITSGKETCLHSFANGADGNRPYGSFIQASNGLLYAMTPLGGTLGAGIIFSLDTTSNAVTVLYNFATGGDNDGQEPYGSLVQATDGLLYGTTSGGGASENGVVFSYSITTQTVSILHQVTNSIYDGQTPRASLIQATNGSLYGMTPNGGLTHDGVLFRYDISTSDYSIVHNFCGGHDGCFFYGGPIQAPNGLLYGMATYGGTYGGGIIYSYNTVTDSVTALHDFGGSSDSDGYNPYGNLILATNGLLYGMTYLGGTKSAGIIFSYNITTGIYTDLYNFTDGSDGGYPLASLLQVNDSLLYGTTIYGGTGNNDGTIFSYNIITGKEMVLYSFTNTTYGYGPQGTLMLASNGLLYGTASYGGPTNIGFGNNGTIFSYDIMTGVYTDIHDLGNLGDGEYPYAALVEAAGVLYGTTAVSPDEYPQYEGTLFSYNINTTAYSVLHNFGLGTDGAGPQCTPIIASNGSLYGGTFVGGINGLGMIFRYDISTNTYSDIYDFSGYDGIGVSRQLLEVDSQYTTSVNQLLARQLADKLSIYPNPTSSAVFVKINSAALNVNDWSLQVTDVLGRTLYTKSSLNYTNEIDLSDLPSGVYFISVVNKADRAVFPIVKQ